MLFADVVLISFFGILTIATTSKGELFAIRQTVWVVIGVVGYLFVSNLDVRFIKRNGYLFYLFSISLLILVFVNGVLSHGARRWISFGFVHIQPSEFIKLAVILMLAAYFDENPKAEPYGFKDLIYPLFIVFFPIIFILKQPDLGTAIVVLFIALSIVLIAGVKKSLIIRGVLLFLVLLPFMWSNLKPYQKDRIMGFIDPYSAPTTYGYNTIQSEIAIGSGGLFGCGIKSISQTQLSFLPENHTDFIFAVFSREWGLLGDLMLIVLYGFIVYRAFIIAKSAKSDFDQLTAIGVLSFIWISVIFNMGMTMGLLPVVGIPLIFFSYGGSATITAFLAVGLLQAIKFREKL
ncbi:rod shape-determining protein RodA [Hippea jasoniae]|uniref:rod shape-determining protein RodA n=1 Tax=Hippea jasoniae TaxID=944479 RepID=UPI00068DDEBA|nr:rod shape-determining protein RodA [Hippea jasoniae]